MKAYRTKRYAFLNERINRILEELNMAKAYLVNHTHWDREWYFTVQDAQVLSEQLFTEVLDELEKHPEANFTFDGLVPCQ